MKYTKTQEEGVAQNIKRKSKHEKPQTMTNWMQINKISILPNDCKNANRLPAAIPPPLAIARNYIILAAMEPASIPPEVKPMEARRAGVKATVTTPPEPTTTALPVNERHQKQLIIHAELP